LSGQSKKHADNDFEGVCMFRTETVSGGETILIVTGPVLGDTAVEFGQKIEALIAGRSSTISLDLSQVPAMNSQAIGKMLMLRGRLFEQNRVLRIQGCSDALLGLFKMIKLDSLIPIEK
jgi:anti-anti-sigma regulatory factor